MNDVQIKSPADLGLIGDTRNLASLKKMGNGTVEEQAEALKTAAAQFESLLMKQCFDAFQASNESLCPDSPLHSKYSGFFEDMLTQQRVEGMLQKRGPLNKNSITYLITKQFAGALGDEGKRLLESLTAHTGPSERIFSREVSVKGANVRARGLSPLEQSQARASIAGFASTYERAGLPDVQQGFRDPQDFVDKLMPYALKAVEESGMNPLVLVSQAALETGWGEHVPQGNNYYGIKAGSGWSGETEDFGTHEYVNGEKVNLSDTFRAYPSLLESMQDYVSLIQGQERYAKAAPLSWDPERYFDEIQKAGYATDPEYASKLKSIARRVAFMAY